MSQLAYYEFMGYSSDELRARYAPYAERFPAGATVLDLGCGRGEFLELLGQRRVEAVGLDLDSDMVAHARGKGLNALEGEGTSFLREHPAGFDGIFCAHLIEHLPPIGVKDLIVASGHALKPGGRLLLVTPNPRNLQMHLRDFWIDLQHTRFYSADIINWLFHDAGFRDIETGENLLYGAGPDFVRSPKPPLPLPFSEASRPGLQGYVDSLRTRLGKTLLPASTVARVSALEERMNGVIHWMQSLYPSGEYYVTGLH